jgi:WD40 repeat protein
VQDLIAGSELLGLDVDGHVDALAFSPDGRRIAGGVYRWPHPGPDDGLRVWDVATGEVVLTRGASQKRFQRVRFDPTGALVAASTGTSRDPATVSVVEVTTGRVRWALRGLPSKAHQLAFSPDGKRLAVTGEAPGIHGGEVKLWDLATGREVLTLEPGQSFYSHQVAFGEDGQRLY